MYDKTLPVEYIIKIFNSSYKGPYRWMYILSIVYIVAISQTLTSTKHITYSTKYMGASITPEKQTNVLTNG